MSNDNRMKSYNIVDPTTKKVRGKTRVNPRLVSFALALTLVATAAYGTIRTSSKENDNKEETLTNKTDFDIEIVNAIIKSHPNMLFDREIVMHEVGGNDTLIRIAEKYNTTVRRIKELNDRKSDTIYYKETLKVEQNTPKSELDQSIIMRESYINDYVLSSEFAKIARNEIPTKNGENELYFTTLYGLSDSNEIDSNSIFGMNAYAKATYHGSEQSESDKIKYNRSLEAICQEIEHRINLDGIAKYVLSYDEFADCIKNGNTNAFSVETNKKY